MEVKILEIASLEESPNALASHYEVKFSKPINGQWFWELLEKAIKQYFQPKSAQEGRIAALGAMESDCCGKGIDYKRTIKYFEQGYRHYCSKCEEPCTLVEPKSASK